jgi:hypothetical protein
MSTEDNKYDSLRSRLKSLPKVNAKAGFNERLLARIRETELNKQQAVQTESAGSGFSISRILDSLFRPAFVPALGLTVVLIAAIVVYFGYFAGKNDATKQIEFSSSQNERHDGFVIYVKSDKEYPKNEIAALEQSDKLTTGPITTDQVRPAPMETKSDFYAPKTEEPSIRNDKVSEEQRIEMQRSLDKEPMKIEGRRKSDESKDYKMEKKAPSNFNREDKGFPNQEIDGMDSEQKKDSGNEDINLKSKEAESPTEKNDDSIKTGKIVDKKKETKKSKSVKDSTKTNKTIDADEKLKEEQK